MITMPEEKVEYKWIKVAPGIRIPVNIHYDYLKRTVTVSNCTDIETMFLHKILYSYGAPDVQFTKEYNGRIPNYICGTARCHPDDRFDEDTGCKIAILRFKQKFQMYYSQLCKQYLNIAKEKLMIVQELFKTLKHDRMRTEGELYYARHNK